VRRGIDGIGEQLAGSQYRNYPLTDRCQFDILVMRSPLVVGNCMQFDQQRRALMSLLGGAAAAWPLAARAQQAGKLLTIGLLGAATLSTTSPWVAAFLQRLRDFGWVEGRNIVIEYRWVHRPPAMSLAGC